jgi:small subunit ribosomal protein S17
VSNQAVSSEGGAAPEAGAAGEERARRRTVEGTVVSAKMQKTITVETSYLKLHPKYKKFVRRYTTYKAHDEKGEAREGDLVEIQQTRPLSKTKRYRLLKVIRRARA